MYSVLYRKRRKKQRGRQPERGWHLLTAWSPLLRCLTASIAFSHMHLVGRWEGRQEPVICAGFNFPFATVKQQQQQQQQLNTIRQLTGPRRGLTAAAQPPRANRQVSGSYNYDPPSTRSPVTTQ
ncbi:hypothetical protein M752DRAFT_262300 [Aspergillus phoenicis ATCC 13157]|uniref:Uncharacterized protein n=1 Tax=Aspergillus phoenicis ATCC 13157 TaxID=1353007 RepID=A0A370PYV8_ASPPH|nr:hypothetical protein M752DRAFT_262300 [Aspergillus phoenicis ATCC 13157]